MHKTICDKLKENAQNYFHFIVVTSLEINEWLLTFMNNLRKKYLWRRYVCDIQNILFTICYTI